MNFKNKLKSFTDDEKTFAIRILDKTYDKSKILYNEGTKRICESCNQGCLATLYCEYCVQNYLKPILQIGHLEIIILII